MRWKINPGKSFTLTAAAAIVAVTLGGVFVWAGTPRARTISGGQAEQAGPSNKAPAGAILCRVLEVKQLPKLHLELAVFHQAHKEDGPRLGQLLLSRDGAEGRFETPDGNWHTATVLRLATCFGRGMLAFPASRASLVRKEEIWFKIPVRRGSASDTLR